MPAQSVVADARGHERDRAFTVQQFEDLVHSALDAQSLPDSALSFNFGGNVYPPSFHPSRPPRAKDASRRKTGTFSRLRGAFARKLVAGNATTVVPPETRRLASSSVPTLSLLHARTAPASNSNLDLQRPHCTAPSSPAFTTGPSSFLETRLPSFDLNNGSRSHSNSPSLNISPRERSTSNSRSFLGLKPITIPKLTKKSSGGLFSTGSLPTPPDSDTIRGASPSATDDFISVAPEGMYSFFDDSGFEDLCMPKVTRKKSKASFRSIFSSAASENHTGSHSASKRDKALPPTPVLDKPTKSSRRKSFRIDVETFSRRNSTIDDRRGSLFYSPPSGEQCFPETHSTYERLDSEAILDKQSRNNKMTDWLIRSTSSTPRRMKRLSRSSVPAYPSPTSPLPPTPNLTFSDLPGEASQKTSHGEKMNNIGDSIQDSIDSAEIFTCRMPSFEHQVTKTSTSTTHVHTVGRPSCGSIRDRLGLGPRLQVHVPLPSQFVDSTRRPNSRQGNFSDAAFRKATSPLLTAPSSFCRSSSPRIPLPRLASASLVSLRSITTVTAKTKGSGAEDEEDDRMEALGMDRAFTPEDDPFAADPPTPLTPLTPVNLTHQPQSTKEEKYKSFMRLENDSSASCGAVTPISAPASLPSWHYRLGSNSNISSPVLPPSSSFHGAIPVPRRSGGDASPSSVQSRLTPSFVEPLGIRYRAPSTPLDQPSSHDALKRVISRVQKIQSNQNECRISTTAGQTGFASNVVGHTESRPNSPFPMLSLKPGLEKCVPAASGDRRRSSTASFVWNEGEDRGSALPTGIGLLESPVDHYSLQVQDREILSPTAWLLDSDDYEDEKSVGRETDTPSIGTNGLAVCLNASGGSSRQMIGDTVDRRVDTVFTRDSLSNARCVSPSPGLLLTESETEIEGDITLLRASQSWPLPPHRTLVVDEESGEGFHVVEPILEFVQADSATHSPRHSIRFPKRRSGSTSISSHTSQLSGGSSPTSQRLNSSQTRIIAEHFGRSNLNLNNDFTPLAAMQIPNAGSGQQLKLRSRSTTSLASVSAWSTRTSKTAFYSAGSTVSHGSNKSACSSHPPRAEKLSREGSNRSVTSSRGPPSSSENHMKSLTLHQDSSVNPFITESTDSFIST